MLGFLGIRVLYIVPFQMLSSKWTGLRFWKGFLFCFFLINGTDLECFRWHRYVSERWPSGLNNGESWVERVRNKINPPLNFSRPCKITHVRRRKHLFVVLVFETSCSSATNECLRSRPEVEKFDCSCNDSGVGCNRGQQRRSSLSGLGLIFLKWYASNWFRWN